MPVDDDFPTPSRPNRQAPRADLVRFRAWRERHLPHASYLITPSFWTPAGTARAQGLQDHERRMLKRWEPQITGLAYTGRRIYMTVVATIGGYEHVARLLHARVLMRDDPDYTQHRGKRVSMLLLCEDCTAAVADFARRQRVRTVTTRSSSASQRAPALSPGDA